MSLTIWQVDPAHLTPYYDAALCNALANCGCRVRLLTSAFLYEVALPCSGSFNVDELYFRGLNWSRLVEHDRLRRCLRGLSYPLGHLALLRRTLRERPSVIHFQWLHLPLLDARLIRLLQRYGTKVVFTAHDVESLFSYRQFQNHWQIYAAVNKVVVHTESNRRALLDRYLGIPPKKVAVIPHLEVSFKVPISATRDQARSGLQIPADAHVCLFFGTIRSYKGVDILLEAFVRAQVQCPNLYLMIVGRCDDHQLAARLRALSHRALIRLTYVPSDQVWQYHLAADVAMFPYRRVSQSGALITAMSFGLPVIAADIGGLSETVVGNGWIVPPNDVTALAAAMIESSKNGFRLHSMAERSRTLIREQHDPHIVAESLQSIYEELVS